MIANDFVEGVAEFADAVGVDEGVYDGIEVGEDDGRVYELERGVRVFGVEEGEVVDDV